jgi:glutathione S-transferase
MSDLKLTSHHLCPYVQRAVIVLLEKGVAHERTYIDLANRPAWFVEKSPLGRVPILESKGAVLFESQVIAEYLDEITEGSLHPEDPLEKARHRAWIEFGSSTLSAVGALYNASAGEEFETKRQALALKLARIEGEIQGPWFGGDQFHMIDGVWGTIFRYFDLFDQITDLNLYDGLTRLPLWRAKVMSRPSVIAATPEGYGARLTEFLSNRPSHLGQLTRDWARAKHTVDA